MPPDRIVLIDPRRGTSVTTEVIIDDPSPERLWKVVHCSGATAWIKRTLIQKIKRNSKMEYVSKDSLIEMELDSKMQTEIEIEGELVGIKFTDDFIYGIVKPNKGGHPYALARIHRTTKAIEILWHFDPKEENIEVLDAFQNECILIHIWVEEEDDERVELLTLSNHSRRRICTADKVTLRLPQPYFVRSREGIRILIDSAIDPVDKLVAMEANSDPNVWADRIVLVDPFR